MKLKTPLTSISGFVETLQDGAAEDPDVRAKFLDIIAIEAAKTEALIEDILIISDIENKREVNTDSDINVRESLKSHCFHEADHRSKENKSGYVLCL